MMFTSEAAAIVQADPWKFIRADLRRQHDSAAAVLVTGLLVVMNRWSVYRALPYAVLGILLWFSADY
jgi:Na+/H+ antiporter NhaA